MTRMQKLVVAFAAIGCAFPGAAMAQLGGGNAFDRLLAMEQAEKATQAINSASVIVLGRVSKGSEVVDWLTLMTTPEYGMTQQVSAGVTFIDAVKFLKLFIARPAGAALRAEAIDNAYVEVLGRPTTALEQATWDGEVKAGKAWYAPIVLKATANLNANPAERTAMIGRAYQRAEGRTPYPGDLDYWGKRSQHFREIVQAERNWLYTPAGAKELVAVAARAWTASYGTPANDANIKAMLIKATPGKMVFEEMVKSSKPIKIS